MYHTFYLVLFRLSSLDDLCNIIARDFTILPTPKVIYAEDNKLYFISDISISLHHASFLFCAFTINMDNKLDRFLLNCNVSEDSNNEFSIFVLKTRGFIKDSLSVEINISSSSLFVPIANAESFLSILESCYSGIHLLHSVSSGEYIIIGKRRIYSYHPQQDTPISNIVRRFQPIACYSYSIFKL